jgi:hypothetical protein
VRIETKARGEALVDQPEPLAGLAVAREVFARMDAAGIAYCHWKSNEHLGAALDGLTDLDVLVDQHAGSDLQPILAVSGFKRFAAPPLRSYPGIEDYLAFDQGSGRLVHLHLHFQLTIGERHLKGYRVPWERAVLATRRFDAEHGIYVADPGIEMVLLLVRAALKRRTRDRVLHICGAHAATGEFGRELAWLRRQVDDATVRDRARKLLGAAIDKPLGDWLQASAAPDRLGAFARIVRRALRPYRTYGPLQALLLAWRRELHCMVDAVNRRYLHRPVPLRRVCPRGGAIVVLLGSDGAGKTSVARTILAWLRPKLDVVPVYFGSGDGPGAIYRAPLRLAYRICAPLMSGGKPVSEGGAQRPKSHTIRTKLRACARVPWALALSLEKRSKLRRIVKARNLGMVVVCDRFPQAAFPGFNDGPLLSHWRAHRFALWRALAAWEARPYRDAALQPLDVVIKLSVEPEIAALRRPEMGIDELRRRVEAVQALSFPAAMRVVELDTAAAPLEMITRAVKRLVWEAI